MVYRAGVGANRGGLGREGVAEGRVICMYMCVYVHTRRGALNICRCVPVDVHMREGGIRGGKKKEVTEGRICTHADSRVYTHTRGRKREKTEKLRKRDKETDTDRERDNEAHSGCLFTSLRTRTRERERKRERTRERETDRQTDRASEKERERSTPGLTVYQSAHPYDPCKWCWHRWSRSSAWARRW